MRRESRRESVQRRKNVRMRRLFLYDRQDLKGAIILMKEML